jgi:Tfp pilus assembly protein PilN
MTLREINLIPEDILFRKDLNRHLMIWGIVLFISLFFILGFYLYQRDMVSGLKVPPSLLADIEARLLSKADEIRALQRKLSNLDQQENHLRTLSGQQSFSGIMSGIIIHMNDNTWLTRLEIDSASDDNGYDIKMNGYSLYRDSLGDFVEKLAHDHLFQSVYLKYARKAEEIKSGDNSGPVQFQLECRTSR